MAVVKKTDGKKAIQLAHSTLQMGLKKYVVTGRRKPTEKDSDPEIFQMKIFARDPVLAKSRFWYFLNKLKKIRKSNGETLDVRKDQSEDTSTVKNYGVWIRYDSRTGTHNMYKEFRDISECGAISQMYCEMAAKHRAASSCIQILKIQAIKDDECRRPHIQQLLVPDLKFPQLKLGHIRPKAYKTTFSTRRPQTFVG